MTCKLRAVFAVAIFFVGTLSSLIHAQMTAVWDGGNDDFAAAKWNDGMTATDVFGDNRISDGAWDVTIGGGSTVTYAAGPGGTGNAIRPRSNVGPTTITIKEGSTFHQTTIADGDTDGMWTTYDADLNLDNGTFKRDFTPGGNAQAGGILMFGSWRSVQDQQISINLTNGGKLENDGQVWFGADEEHAVGLKVFVTINNGSWDLTGGDNYPTSNDTNVVLADWAIFYGRKLAEGNGTDMSGDPKGEQYKVNFKGPGTITVDSGGIAVYDQDVGGIWTQTDATYEELWNRGILRSGGVSGGFWDPVGETFVSTGRAFANFFDVTGTLGTDNYTLTRKEPTVVTWDGGAGEWNADAKWNGGQAATAVMGTNSGALNRGSDGGHAVVLDGSKPGGADVTFDPNPGTGAANDFRMRVDNGISSLTITNGATFTIHTASDVDGKWTRQGSDLTIEGAGSVYRRTKDNVNSLSGGVLLLGAFNQQQGQEIDVNIRDGGRLENDGQVWFGTDDSAQGLTVNINIDGGSVDLTGGDSYPMSDLEPLGIQPDLLFFHAYRTAANASGPFGPSDEKYAINFTGPGTFTVDHSGIYAVTEDEGGLFTAAAKTYEELWADGILQANGQSGLTGATFGDFFSVTGMHLMDNYTLTSLIGGVGLAGDYNGDGSVDAADFVVWRNGDSPDDTQAGFDLWRANFGNTSGAGAGLASSAAVPEPTTLALVALALAAGLLRRRS